MISNWKSFLRKNFRVLSVNPPPYKNDTPQKSLLLIELSALNSRPRCLKKYLFVKKTHSDPTISCVIFVRCYISFYLLYPRAIHLNHPLVGYLLGYPPGSPYSWMSMTTSLKLSMIAWSNPRRSLQESITWQTSMRTCITQESGCPWREHTYNIAMGTCIIHPGEWAPWREHTYNITMGTCIIHPWGWVPMTRTHLQHYNGNL